MPKRTIQAKVSRGGRSHFRSRSPVKPTKREERNRSRERSRSRSRSPSPAILTEEDQKLVHESSTDFTVRVYHPLLRLAMTDCEEFQGTPNLEEEWLKVIKAGQKLQTILDRYDENGDLKPITKVKPELKEKSNSQ